MLEKQPTDFSRSAVILPVLKSDIRSGVYVRAVYHNLKVQVVARGISRTAYICDNLAL